ncbi:MAG: N-acetylneuraminate synthase family protein [Planctomycetota bacterium]
MSTPAATPEFWSADAERLAKVWVIAEIGVNHDGDPARAAELIGAAADVGADAVKFQLFQPDRLLSAEAGLAGYQDGQADDVRALLDRLMLSVNQLRELRGVAQDAGVAFVVTPFSVPDVADLGLLDVDAVKFASPDAVNRPLLDAASGLGRPMLISTGTCELGELGVAAEHAARSGGALLQCVSSYPTPDNEAALGAIAALRQRFGVAVGYSDHTAALDTGALAVVAGACVLEKHLTHDRGAQGPDHAASVEPAGLREYVAAARRAAAMVGPIEKTCRNIERDVRRVSRQSVCTARDLPAGHVLERSDLVVKRPGTGLPAGRFESLVGAKLRRGVRGDVPLRAEDVAEGGSSE